MSDSKKDYTGTIQNLLYCNPLYNYINKEKVNVLVFGYSGITEKFIDFAFEMAQVNGYKLHITVVSDDADAKNEYLKARPAFRKFFSVDDEVVDDNYGILSFDIITFGNIEDDLSEILLNDESNKYAYLFIGSDNDDLNSRIAKVCVDCRKLLDTNFVVNCLSENGKNEDGVNYVHRDDSIESHKDYKTLKSMAFNCHLVWNYSKLLDMRKLQRQFLSDYNYVACLSYVISLKYKLASVGIDFLDSAAPEKFDRLINSKAPTDKKSIEDMVANEHKRWNVNMICRGFKTAESLENFISGKENKANGYHPCLVRGTGVPVLSTDEWKKKNRDKWENCSNKDLQALDELDRVSVLLHKEYTKRANKIKRENIILQSDIDIINKLLESNGKAKNAFDKYYICLQEISAGNSAKTALYDHYYSALTRELNNVPVNQAKIVRKRINVLAASFNAILESEKYIDYKQYDVDLIKKIPFILTYKSNLHIGIPIDLFNIKPSVNTAAFRVVESALLINPSKISYICEFERSDLNNLIKILEYAIKSMDSHHLRSVINICLLTSYPLSEQDTKMITDISNRIHSIDFIKSEEEFVEYSKKKHLQIFEFNRTRSSSILERYEYCCKSNYKYNRSTNKFVATGCEEIKYISFAPFLKISDIFEFKSSVDDYSFPDMQKDYKYFWGLYKSVEFGSEKRWKDLCSLLSAQNETNKFEIKNLGEENIIKTYLIEKVCLDSIKKLCVQIRNAKESISCNIELYSNNSYSVTINAPSGFHKVVSDLLCEAYKLYDPNSINIRVFKGKAYLYYDSLNTGVINAGTIKKVLDPLNTTFTAIKPLLDEICDKGYIRSLTGNETNGISFSYSTHQVKDVMTQSGRILELFVYYKLLETGLFDDVANSVEIHWGSDEAENEIDIIATRGYKVLIVECKAQTVLIQDYYNKLSRLDSDYGLNSVPVIVADTHGVKKHQEENKKMMEIGNRVGIHTVFEKNDISNIGSILGSIVKNN
ncbi:MAG: DUF1887 family protein [Clostridia bacterium]|nr:DUF1887 family protein [Clostridia bacterium]